MRKFILILLFVVSGALVANTPKKIKLSLMDLKAESGIDKGVVNLLYELILTEFQNYSNLSVTSKSDIDSMVKFETEKELAGCSDSSCMAEIGGALGVDMIVMGSIGKLGSSYIVTLKLINIKKATVENRVSKTIPANEDKLIPLMKFLANKLLEKYSKYRIKKDDAIDFKESKTISGKSSSNLYAWITLGTGSALFLSGAVYHFVSVKSFEDDFNRGVGISSKTFNELNDEYENKQIIRNTLLISGGALILTGAGIYFLGSSAKDSDSLAVSPFVTKEGVYVTTFFSF